VTPHYADANHEPTVAIRGSPRITAHPGETVRLQGVAFDPDGNALTVRWWRWKDVDTYPGDVSLSDETSFAASFRVPEDARPGETIQLVLQATDHGSPPLTRSARVVVTVTH